MKDGRLGIIGCYSLSDQILHLIDRDEDVEDLFVVINPEGLRFVEKMKDRLVDRKLHLIGGDNLPTMKLKGFSILVWLNPEDLHNEPAAIRYTQSKILSEMSNLVDSVLFCYGSCRSSEQRIKSLIKQARVPVTFLTDSNGEIVDDCFAAILGGKKAYLDCIMEHKGTLLASTGYEEAWRRKFREMDIESVVQDADWLKFLFDALGYRYILKLDDGLGDQEQFERDIHTFAEIFNLEVITRKCDSRVFERSYDLAKLKIETGRIFQPEGIMAQEPSLSDAILSEWFLR